MFHKHGINKGDFLLRQVTGRKADAVLAAHLASEAALRLVKPGNESYEVTDTVSKIAEAFKCKVTIGVIRNLNLNIICFP